jgi:hypothetical protein
MWYGQHGKLSDTNRRFHDDGAVDLAPHWCEDGDHSWGLDGDQARRWRTISYHALFIFDVIVWILFVLVFRYTAVAQNKIIPNKILNMFSLSEAIATKVLSYGAGHDDRGQKYRSSHISVGTSHVCAAHTLRLFWRALACIDIALGTRDRKVEHGSHGWCDWHKFCLPSQLYRLTWQSGVV